MNNKASPSSTNPTKTCRALFPYFPSLESRLAGEHTVVTSSSTRMDACGSPADMAGWPEYTHQVLWTDRVPFPRGLNTFETPTPRGQTHGGRLSVGRGLLQETVKAYKILVRKISRNRDLPMVLICRPNSLKLIFIILINTSPYFVT
jgi:hypothetical protein